MVMVTGPAVERSLSKVAPKVLPGQRLIGMRNSVLTTFSAMGRAEN